MFCSLLGAVDSVTSTEGLISRVTIAINDIFLLAVKSDTTISSLIHGGESSIALTGLRLMIYEIS